MRWPAGGLSPPPPVRRVRRQRPTTHPGSPAHAEDRGCDRRREPRRPRFRSGATSPLRCRGEWGRGDVHRAGSASSEARPGEARRQRAHRRRRSAHAPRLLPARARIRRRTRATNHGADKKVDRVRHRRSGSGSKLARFASTRDSLRSTSGPRAGPAVRLETGARRASIVQVSERRGIHTPGRDLASDALRGPASEGLGLGAHGRARDPRRLRPHDPLARFAGEPPRLRRDRPVRLRLPLSERVRAGRSPCCGDGDRPFFCLARREPNPGK